ncbi:MAG TPA: argininosuccinate synthase [Actinomycetota bacterium]|nr:argininosuccinate synthase [Actinomycetota bacterium]
MSDKCVLAFSGGLDTSVCVAWLRENHGYDVVALTVDVGQGAELEGLEVRAEAAGVSELVVVDAREEFVTGFCWPALRANALYEGRYPLVSALSRPLIASHLVRVARETGATAIAHGCTGKGNDQVRFETSIAALGPDLTVHAPIRETGMQRDQALAYAAERGIPVVATKEKPYSVDENLWGRAIESGVLEDPWTAPPDKDVYEFTLSPQEAPDEPAEVVIGFEAGLPVSVDGEAIGPVEIVRLMQELAGRHGVGRIDMIENRLVGIKSREVYEVPASLALITAHRDLEDLVLERDLAHFKQSVELRYAELVYNGLWFSPLKRSLDAFVDSTQDAVTGEVRLRLHKGTARPTGRRSERALYSPELATYGSEGDAFRHDAAAGFITLWSLPVRVWAQRGGAGS